MFEKADYQTYGCPDDIMEELLRKSIQLSAVESLDSFTDSWAIRNFASVFDDDSTKLVGQR